MPILISRNPIGAHLPLMVVLCTLVSACASMSDKEAAVLDVRPERFRCPGTDGNGPVTAQLKITQNSTGDATSVLCESGPGCDSADPGRRPEVERQQWVRWMLKEEANRNQTFYVVFEGDHNPSNARNGFGTAISSSNDGKLCLHVNRSARGGEYPYSVFVQYCEPKGSCAPVVLDPIIYVKN